MSVSPSPRRILLLLVLFIFAMGAFFLHRPPLGHGDRPSNSQAYELHISNNDDDLQATTPGTSAADLEEIPSHDFYRAEADNLQDASPFRKKMQSLKDVFAFVPNGVKSCQDLFDGKPLSSVIPDDFMEDFERFQQKLVDIADDEKIEGYSAMFKEEFMTFYLVAKAPFVKTVCETGFNAGHSAFTWLRANPNTKVYSFDIGRHDYGVPISEHLQKKFPGRLNVTWGNSKQTLPLFLREHPSVTCDLIIVDGGHIRDVCQSDYDTFKHMANEPNILVFDNYPDTRKEWMTDLGDVWEGGKRNGEIIEIFGCDFQPMRRQGFSVGQINVRTVV